MSDDEIIAVVQAHKEGKKIEYKLLGTEQKEWMPSLVPIWNFGDYKYRVAPEPRKPREFRIKFDEGSQEIKGITSAVDARFVQGWIRVREVLE